RMSKRQGYCCSILGGNRIDFINLYSTASLSMIEDPSNQSALQSLRNNHMHIFLIEQYLLSAFANYHTSRPGSPFGRIEAECLFNTMDESEAPDYVARAGFSHLGGPAKKNGLFAERLENRVRRDYPEHYRRCLKYIEDQFSPKSIPQHHI